MKNLYDITKGQLITLWVFGVILFLFCWGNTQSYDPSTLLGLLAAAVPFSLIFYTIGWRNHKKH